MTAKYFVDQDGNYIGAFDGYRKRHVDQDGNVTEGDFIYPALPENAVEVPEPPEHSGQKWDGSAYGVKPPEQRSEIEAMKRALIKKGLISQTDIEGER